jgi:hypothetical protein
MFPPTRRSGREQGLFLLFVLLLGICKLEYLYTALTICNEDVVVVIACYEVGRLAVVCLAVANFFAILVENNQTV